jgi:hypothetical protein
MGVEPGDALGAGPRALTGELVFDVLLDQEDRCVDPFRYVLHQIEALDVHEIHVPVRDQLPHPPGRGRRPMPHYLPR